MKKFIKIYGRFCCFALFCFQTLFLFTIGITMLNLLCTSTRNVGLCTLRSHGNPLYICIGNRPLETLEWRHLSVMASQITRLFVPQLVQVDVKKNAKLCITGLFVWGIHRWPVDSPHKGSVMRTAFQCHDVIICTSGSTVCIHWMTPWVRCKCKTFVRSSS